MLANRAIKNTAPKAVTLLEFVELERTCPWPLQQDNSMFEYIIFLQHALVYGESTFYTVGISLN